MSSPLDFQTEGPVFESHQGNIFSYFFSSHSLKMLKFSRMSFFRSNQDRNFNKFYI